MKRFVVVMAVLCLVLTAGCTQMAGQKDVYYVMFDSQPRLYDTKVYLLSKPIGDILSQDKIALNSVKLTVKIDSDYTEIIKNNTVFFEDMGKLHYASVGGLGKTVEPGAKLLGFDSKLSLYWFKTKTLLSQSAAAAQRRANQLYEKAENQK